MLVSCVVLAEVLHSMYLDIVVRHGIGIFQAPVEDIEPEIPPPVDAFKKPEPIPAAPEEKPQDPLPTPVAPAAPIAPEDGKSHEPEPGSPEASSEQDKPDPASPEAPKVEDVTPVAPVIDNKPEPVYPSLDDVTPAAPSLIGFDPIPAHPEPSAPAVPADHVIIATDDPALPDIAAAVPFVPHVPGTGTNDGLISLDDDIKHVAPGFEVLFLFLSSMTSSIFLHFLFIYV